MYLEQKTGSAPGLIYATIRRGKTVRTFAIEVRITPSGHYIARMPNQRWSIACLTEDNALLMHAAILFPIEHEEAPWLANPRPTPKSHSSLLQPFKKKAQELEQETLSSS